MARSVAQNQRNVKKVIRYNNRLWGKEYKHTNNNRNNNSKIFFQKTIKVKDRYNTRPIVMKKNYGTLLTESKEIACDFKDLFEKLFNQPSENIIVHYYTTIEQLLEKLLEVK